MYPTKMLLRSVFLLILFSIPTFFSVHCLAETTRFTVADYIGMYGQPELKEKEGHVSLTLCNKGLSSLAGLEQIEAPERVTSIYLNKNHLEIVPKDVFSRFRNVKEIILSENALSFLQEGAFSNLEKLERVTLDCNQLASLQGGVFKQTPNLRRLDLSYNLISGLQNGVFEGLEQLEDLSLMHNQIKGINDVGQFMSLRSLRHLNLSHNQIKSLSNYGFRHVKTLEELDLSGNDMASVSLKAFFGLKNLNSLNLSNNSIRDALNSLTVLRGLRWLTLDFENCIELPFDSLKLEQIGIAGLPFPQGVHSDFDSVKRLLYEMIPLPREVDIRFLY